MFYFRLAGAREEILNRSIEAGQPLSVMVQELPGRGVVLLNGSPLDLAATATDLDLPCCPEPEHVQLDVPNWAVCNLDFVPESDTRPSERPYICDPAAPPVQRVSPSQASRTLPLAQSPVSQSVPAAVGALPPAEQHDSGEDDDKTVPALSPQSRSAANQERRAKLAGEAGEASGEVDEADWEPAPAECRSLPEPPKTPPDMDALTDDSLAAAQQPAQPHAAVKVLRELSPRSRPHGLSYLRTAAGLPPIDQSSPPQEAPSAGSGWERPPSDVAVDPKTGIPVMTKKGSVHSLDSGTRKSPDTAPLHGVLRLPGSPKKVPAPLAPAPSNLVTFTQHDPLVYSHSGANTRKGRYAELEIAIPWPSVEPYWKATDGMLFDVDKLKEAFPCDRAGAEDRRRLFRKWDENASGSISLAEFGGGLNMHVIKVMERSGRKPKLSDSGQCGLYKYGYKILIRAFKLANGADHGDAADDETSSRRRCACL